MFEQQTPPEPDALEPPSHKHPRPARNRRFGALALVAVIIALIVFAVITLQDGADEEDRRYDIFFRVRPRPRREQLVPRHRHR